MSLQNCSSVAKKQAHRKYFGCIQEEKGDCFFNQTEKNTLFLFLSEANNQSFQEFCVYVEWLQQRNVQTEEWSQQQSA